MYKDLKRISIDFYGMEEEKVFDFFCHSLPFPSFSLLILLSFFPHCNASSTLPLSSGIDPCSLTTGCLGRLGTGAKEAWVRVLHRPDTSVQKKQTHPNKCKKHGYPLPSNYDSALIYTFLEYKYRYAALLILSILSNRSIQKCFISTRNKNQEDQFKICRLCSNCIKGSNSL